MTKPEATQLRMLTWEATVKVYPVRYLDNMPISAYGWEVEATWDDFHGATLDISVERPTIADAVAAIWELKAKADHDVLDDARVLA